MPILPRPHRIQESRISGTYVFVMVPDGCAHDCTQPEHAVLVP